MTFSNISVTDGKNSFLDIIRQVEGNKRLYTVQKRGKNVAYISPIREITSMKKFFGSGKNEVVIAENIIDGYQDEWSEDVFPSIGSLLIHIFGFGFFMETLGYHKKK